MGYGCGGACGGGRLVTGAAVTVVLLSVGWESVGAIARLLCIRLVISGWLLSLGGDGGFA